MLQWNYIEKKRTIEVLHFRMINDFKICGWTLSMKLYDTAQSCILSYDNVPNFSLVYSDSFVNAEQH